jgi:hypothetical protein
LIGWTALSVRPASIAISRVSTDRRYGFVTSFCVLAHRAAKASDKRVEISLS